MAWWNCNFVHEVDELVLFITIRGKYFLRSRRSCFRLMRKNPNGLIWELSVPYEGFFSGTKVISSSSLVQYQPILSDALSKLLPFLVAPFWLLYSI